MRKSGAFVVLIASLVIMPATTAISAESSTLPPKHLKLVGDHWTAWDPPEAAPGAYIIVKDDCLWNLAEKWLGDPFLWPQIWDENRYILDSHWIYPGDPLVIPGKPVVVPEGGPPPVTDEPEEPAEEPTGEGVGEPTAIEPTPLYPVATETEIHCAGYIDPEHSYSDLWVAGSEMENQSKGIGDVIYLSQGRNQGIQAGDLFTVIRETREVKHPESSRRIGTFIRRLGRVRVMVAQEETATAVIETACEDVRHSDELVPFEEIPIPEMESMPPFDRYDAEPSGRQIGWIVAVADDRVSVATDHIIQTDLGMASGVNPGDVLTIYRDQVDLPRILIGQAVILTVEPLSSTAKIMNSVRECGVGDKVEVIE
jgi:hypothetical protein